MKRETKKRKWLLNMVLCMLVACSMITFKAEASTLADEAKQTVTFGEYDTIDIKNTAITTLKVVLKEKGTFELDFQPEYAGFLNAQLYDENNNLLGSTSVSKHESVFAPSDIGINYSLDAGTYYLRLWTNSKDYAKTYTYFARQIVAKDATLEICITLKKGKSIQLGAILNNCKDKKIKWTSSKKKIATVSSKGKVKAKKKGTTTIKAYNSSGLVAKIKVKVTKK